MLLSLHGGKKYWQRRILKSRLHSSCPSILAIAFINSRIICSVLFNPNLMSRNRGVRRYSSMVKFNHWSQTSPLYTSQVPKGLKNKMNSASTFTFLRAKYTIPYSNFSRQEGRYRKLTYNLTCIKGEVSPRFSALSQLCPKTPHFNDVVGTNTYC